METHFDHDFEILIMFINDYFEAYPEMITKIESAIEKLDAKTIEISSHTLKGVLANFFANSLLNALAELEKMGREENLASCKQTYQSIKPLIEHLNLELAFYKDKRKAA